ncbi:MAG TPA: LCP family protein [Acidimicrobiia bacterium]|nr:LCP family protein [Acidimicrobiia bacterium]
MSPRLISPWRAFVRRFVVALAVVTVLASGTVAYAFYYANETIDDIENVDGIDDVLGDLPKGEPANFLIIGSDSRSFVDDAQDVDDFGDPIEQAGQRSDTILIAHVDPDEETGVLVSFPRDLWVDIPGEGEGRINSAFGGENGPRRLIETIKQNFDVDIHHYLEVDFEGFRSIVDAIGSVPIWFPAPARDEFSGLNIPLPGCIELGGDQALHYVRSRHYEYFDTDRQAWRDDPYADLSRIRRQQYFIRSLAAVAIESSSRRPTRAFDIATETVKHLRKDPGLSLNDVLSLVDTFREVDPEKVAMLTVPTERAFVGEADVQVLVPELAEPIFQQLRRFGGAEEPPEDLEPSDVSVRVLNGSGITGQARTTLDALAALDFSVVEPPEDADRSDYEITEVRYAPGAEGKAAFVAQYLGVGQPVPLEAAEGADVVVVLGRDFESVVAPDATTPTTTGGAPPSTVATTTTTIPPNPGSTPGIVAPSRPDGGHPLVGC